MDRRKDDHFEEEEVENSSGEDWVPDNDNEWMDVEESEEEEEETHSLNIPQNTNDMMEEEKLPAATSSRKTQNIWSAYYHQHESVAGIFLRHKSLKKEHDKAVKLIQTKKLTSELQKPKSLSKHNELFFNPTNHKAHVFQTFIPNKITYTFEGIGSRIYNANFNQNGDIFLATCQTGTALFNYNDDNQIKLNKTINCLNINWAITDSDFTNDNRFMIHSTLSSRIQLFDVENKKYLNQINVTSQDFDDSDDDVNWYSGTRVYSAKISADGNEVIAGTSRTSNGFAKLQIFDVQQNRVSRSINAHTNDINSICFVEKLNSSLIISGSDDVLCKLWDMRAFNSNNPVGIFYGHLGGMTNVCSKEDGRYFISNCKDQSIKLWDLRKCSTEKKKAPSFVIADYRYSSLSLSRVEKVKEIMKNNKEDLSVSTYFGHEVRDTLIRCHFSPKFITDQRFIYTGSADGCVYIYDILSGENVARLQIDEGETIRDCAWHPFTQNIITTDFDGNICRWEYFDNIEDKI